MRPARGLPYTYVATYLDGGNGTVAPVRTVRYPTPQQWYGNAVADDRYLYIGGDRQVLVYDKTAAGAGPTVAVGP